MSHTAPSDELLQLLADKFRMLSDPTRLAILYCLMDRGEQNVGQIVERTELGLANVSKHLKLLAAAQLVARRKQGAFVLYQISDPVVKKVCQLVCDSLRKQLEAELKRHKQIVSRRRTR